ncbi:GNAT family N-acetyltransferase [Plastoroseomonas arctica]|uniref:GNAT family N-acetyltransferase n=1 Tax=Plastoroseomonas arctica TaxID=1509237 RepID=A0AAF1JU77_9PROT|nr:GNAT family N-acetyltransferase [Plastoroseomonas arctica]MBR0653662.1 GNAT family N-acetyltransferase [Plastoroseomonas arctica]
MMEAALVEVESPLQEEVTTLLCQSDAVAERLYPGEPRRPITAETLTRSGTHVLIARCAGTAVGLCAVFERGDGTAELKRMIVAEGARGRGVGAALLRGVEAEAKRLGADTIVLEVGVRNAEAQALYRRSGYEPCEPFSPYQPSPISLFLKRQL